MDRLISEQAVIDTINEWFNEPIPDECKTSKEMEEYTEKSLIKAIKAISLVEPKTGNCEDCKHFRKLLLHTSTIGKCIHHTGLYPKGNWYCADFELQKSEVKE